MTSIQPVGTKPAVKPPVEHASLEDQAKDLCRMMRTADREYSQLVGKHIEIIETAREETTHKIAATYQSRLPTILNIGATICRTAGVVAVNSPGVLTTTAQLLHLPAPIQAIVQNQHHRQSMQAFTDGASKITEISTSTYENWTTRVDQTTLNGLNDRLKTLMETTQRDMNNTHQELGSYFDMIRRINDERAQTMHALRGG